MKHFYYQRKQRRSALTLLLNVGVLLTMWFAAHEYLTPEAFGQQAEELLYWIDIAAPIVCLLLLVGASWMWLSNKSFEIALTNTGLKVTDPLSSTYTWELPLDTITEIRHEYDVHTKYTVIWVFTHSGDAKQLTQNYHFSRKKLYAAIKKVAPHITLPQNPYRFTKPKLE
jgi:hypothetical protein